MGSVTRRGDRWLVRYRDLAGKEKIRHFARKVDAEQWLREQLSAMDRGQWVDWRRGRRTFGDYAAEWQALQVHYRPSSARAMGSRLRVHVLPRFADRRLAAITRTEVQTWVAELATRLSPNMVASAYRAFAQVTASAVDDKVIAESPCRRIQLPERTSREMVPLTVEQVHALADATPDRYRAAVWLAAGTGMRLGEVLGLTVDRINWLRKTIRVDRQLQRRVLAPPKTRASVRTIPVADETVEVLAAHMAAFPAVDGFLFTTGHGRPIAQEVWQAMWTNNRTGRTGVTGRAGVRARFHDLRHFYASALIAAGVSVKVVQARLGHATAKETLDTYGHLWPDDEDRTRGAIAAALKSAKSPRESRTVLS